IPATVEQIKNRYSEDTFDPKGVCYVIDDEGHPQAYIQTRSLPSQKRTFIGYPWAVNNCPKEIQETLFSEMLSYIQQRDPEHKIVMGYIQAHWTEVHDFARDHKMKINSETKQFGLNPTQIGKLNIDGFKIVNATENDIEILMTLAETEVGFLEFFIDNEAAIKFFKQMVSERETLLIFKNDELVCAGALVATPNTRNFNINFTLTNPKYLNAWKILTIKLAQKAVENGWGEKQMIVIDTLPEQVTFCKEHQAHEIVLTLYEIL
ncbi:MAG: hypothetical protein ACXAC7_22795, partial [Candidatus Hodarchaeales archaeon]